MKIQLSREYTIPHYDWDWTIMTMKHITIWVTVTQDVWESEQQVKDNLERIYEEQIKLAIEKSPTTKRYKNKLSTLVELVKPLIDPTKYQEILKKVKAII